MAKSLILAALAALPSLVLAAPEPATKLPKASPAIQAIEHLARDLDARLEGKPGAKLSPQQKALVRQVFGSEDPVQFKRLPAKGGGSRYNLTLPASHYEADGVRTSWQDMVLKVSIAPNGARQATGAMSALDAVDPKGVFAMRDANINVQRQRDPLLGSYRLGVASFTYTMNDGSVPFALRQLGLTGESKRQGKFLNFRTDFSIGQARIITETIERLHFGARVRNVDAEVVTEWKKSLETLQQKGETDAQANAEFMARAKDLFQRMVLRGGSLEFDDISAVYHGNKASMTLSLSMPNAKPDDFANAESVLKKLELRVQAKLPLPMLRDITRRVAENTNRGKDKPEQPTDKLASDMYAGVLGKLLADKLARMENDALLSTLELKNGILTVNGKAMPIEPLLAMLNKKDDKRPPADTSEPVRISMRQRGLEVARLFALNGHYEGLYDLCERHLTGIDLPQDTAEGAKQCWKAMQAGSGSAALALTKLYWEGTLEGDFAPVLAHLQGAADHGENAAAQYQLYRLYAAGKGVAKDQGKAMAYLRMAANGGHQEAIAALKKAEPSARIDAKPAEANGPWLFEQDPAAGYFAQDDFRFDAAKLRRLTLSLGSFKQHEKWQPIMNACLSALKPSDRACVRFHGDHANKTLVVYSETMSTDGSNKRGTVTLPIKVEEGDALELQVYANGKEAFFVVNGNKPLVQKIDFPAEVLALSCSTGKCRFEFEQAGK